MRILMLVGLLVTASIVSSIAAGNDQILFLNMKLVRGKAYLESTTVVPGKLKQPKTVTYVKGELYFTVLSASGGLLYEGTIHDPSLIRVEYEDSQGQMQIRTVVMDNVEFSIRVPYVEPAHELVLYKIEDVAYVQKKPEPSMQKIGSMTIKTDEDSAEE